LRYESLPVSGARFDNRPASSDDFSRRFLMAIDTPLDAEQQICAAEPAHVKGGAERDEATPGRLWSPAMEVNAPNNQQQTP
jgi:hypothetical protein